MTLAQNNRGNYVKQKIDRTYSFSRRYRPGNLGISTFRLSRFTINKSNFRFVFGQSDAYVYWWRRMFNCWIIHDNQKIVWIIRKGFTIQSKGHGLWLCPAPQTAAFSGDLFQWLADHEIRYCQIFCLWIYYIWDSLLPNRARGYSRKNSIVRGC